MSASCSSDPDSRRSASSGFLSERCSDPRLSWQAAMTGIPSPQVVDDDELEAVAGLEAAALGADLRQGHVRGVVDEQGRGLDRALHLRQPRPVGLVEVAFADLLEGDTGFR
jgi:hypothetical protein